jgi:RNA processing factor Prp31
MNDDKYLTKFPETVDIIDSNQQYYKTVLESLKLLNNSVFAKNAEESKCPIT